MVSVSIPVKITSAQLDVEEIRRKLEAFKKEFLEEFTKSLIVILKSPATAEVFIKECIDVLAQMQEEYFGGASAYVKTDPTQFMDPRQVAAIRTEVYENFSKAAEAASGNIEELSLTLISDKFMGIGADASSATDGIPWLGHFIYGSLDSDLVWITPEVHAILVPDDTASHLGRFGAGHLWHVSSQGLRNIVAHLNSLKLNLTEQDLRHPQSGKAGKDWFGHILSEDRFNQFIRDPALQIAQDRVKLEV